MNTKTKNLLIRIFYIIPFLIFAYAFVDELFIVDKRFQQVDYKVVIPMIIFLYQSIRNSISGWILVILLYLMFMYLLGDGIVNSYYDLGAKIDKQTFIIQIAIGLLFLGFGYLYWRIRPKKRLI